VGRQRLFSWLTAESGWIEGVGLNFHLTMVFLLSVTGQASSHAAQNGVIVDLALITALVTPVLTTGLVIKSRQTGLKESGGLIAGVAQIFLCLMEVENQASVIQTVRLSSAAQSGATAGETKNTVDAQNVSTMPDEGLKVNFRQIYSNVIICK